MYVGLERYQEDNDQIEQDLVMDIAQLKKEGRTVVLVGDANGHIGEMDGGVEGVVRRTDRNGRRILRIMDQMGMVMVNRSRKCTGKWTWMRAQQKSVIDYVLIEDGEVDRVVKMVIEGKGLADSV